MGFSSVIKPFQEVHNTFNGAQVLAKRGKPEEEIEDNQELLSLKAADEQSEDQWETLEE